MSKKHPDEAEDRALIEQMMFKSGTKVDPSVSELDQYTKGEPRGSVPLDRTLRKPDAYYPAKPGAK